MMDDIYRYPIFFECPSLPREQIKKIQRYFGIQRRSKGGDCGPVRRVNDEVCSIAFKYQRDQQAVLQKKEHVVRLADGCLTFTVRGSLDPPSSPITTSTASHDYTAEVQSPQSIPAPTSAPRGEDYELQLDTFLLQYLKECPEAWKEQEKERSSEACSAQLYPEEKGRSVVKCLAQPGAADEIRNWRTEADPHRVAGAAGGESAQVKDRLMDVEDRSGQKESSAIVKQTGKIPTGDMAEITGVAQNTARGVTVGARGDVENIQGTIETQQVLKSVQETLHFKEDVHQADHVSATKRIVLLGKSGSGKSNLANTIFGEEELFTTSHSSVSGTKKCQAETKSANGRRLTVIDTPGFFDTKISEDYMKPKIVRCITECAPGPHALLIVLKVDRFTEQEQDVINKICEYFSEDALKYAVIVFTHGDQLPEGMKIEEFVSQNKNLSDLVKKCGGRCHVVDNKYWKHKQQNNYRSNQFQVEDLPNTIDKMVMENNGGYYTNTMFEIVEKEIQKEEENIRQSSGNLPAEEIRKQAKTRVSERLTIQLAGTATGVVLGAFCGVATMVGVVIRAINNYKGLMTIAKRIPAVGGAALAAAGGVEAAGLTAAGVVVGVTAAGMAATGGVIGGMIGRNAAEGAKTPLEAAQRAAKAVLEKGKATWEQRSNTKT